MSGFFKHFSNTAETVNETVSEFTRETEKLVDPMRRSFSRRFPTLFMFLITVGATTTFLGIERVIERWGIFHEHPLFILLFGMLILFITGTLYKKLG